MNPEQAPYHIWITRDPEDSPPIDKATHLEVVPRALYDDVVAQLERLKDEHEDQG